MSRTRRSAVWLLSWMLVLPGPNVLAAAARPPAPRGTSTGLGGGTLGDLPRGIAELPRATMLAAPDATATIAEPQIIPADVDCTIDANPIVCENRKAGSPPTEWDLPGSTVDNLNAQPGAGDPSIQGFATDISAVRGQLVQFKVKTPATAYRLDIYRLGFYDFDGARKIDSILPSATLPQTQPACAVDATRGLVDCGNWAVSASWTVPSTAVSGVYLAKLVRTDGPVGASHIVFVVRDDSGGSDLLFQTSDTTWQAYNDYGGASLYRSTLNPQIGRAYAVSYNRPFATRGVAGGGRESWLFNAEYPMIRFLEANGYDVSYSTGVDSDRRGAEILEHKVFLSVGHDEYWSGTQRANVEIARSRGVNLAFFSGNEIFWKTRWETSIDGSGTPHRTLVSYKETKDNKKSDPASAWTGTWRDPRFSPPADGGRPENALAGTLFTVNGPRNDHMRIAAAEGKLRFWRNTPNVSTLVAGDWHDLADGILGYEWNEDVDNGSRPAGLVRLSSTTVDVGDRKLVDYGSTYNTGTATHSLTLYRHDNPPPTPDALVFSAGTIQWSWALDRLHDRGPTVADVDVQQATVNLLADMGAQPANLNAPLVPAVKSLDETGPTSSVDPSITGATVRSGVPVTVAGTAQDTGGLVGAVEVSVDGGTSWHPANGRESWTYTWKPSAEGTATILSRATDDSGNLGLRSPAVTITIGAPVCPCSIWDTSVVPREPDSRDPNAVEVGVKFAAETNGFITALRFYKSATNTGTHVGNLWTAGGTRLATVTFTNETASGWQEARLDSPVQVFAGTTYVASYHAPAGHYARDLNYFQLAGADNQPLHSPVSRTTDRNGVFIYSPISTFPSQHFEATNYWVDVVFDTTVTDTTPPQVVAVTPPNGAANLTLGTTVSATFNEAMAATSFAGNFQLRNAAGTLVPATVTYDPANRRATLTPDIPLEYSTVYTATVGAGVSDAVGNTMRTPFAWSFSTEAPVACPCTIWPVTATPAVDNDPSAGPIELGVKFRVASDGFITGIRFYRGSQNTGIHTGHLWTGSGTLLGEALFTTETASGWQEVAFPTPIAVSAGTTYVASYHTTSGHFSKTENYFTAGDVDNSPLIALGNATSPNGVFKQGDSGFPTSTFRASNYWVDVVFNTTVVDNTPPTVVSTSPASNATSVSTWSAVSATFSESVKASSLGTTTFQLREGTTAIAGSLTYDTVTRTATLLPSMPLKYSTTYTATISGLVEDPAGNRLGGDYSWSFSTPAAPDCPCSIWDDTATPLVPFDPFDGAIELGVRFRANGPGYITGLRFYKGAGNTGPHVGSLWTNDGQTLLARAQFQNETATGWQQVLFATPVPILANTIYVASYHAPFGHYSVDQGRFSAGAVEGERLQAIADSPAARNGVFALSPTPTFPSQAPGDAFASSNYWIDVVFETADDTDGDGVVDVFDNCPSQANPDQADSNGNGVGDVCDAATDAAVAVDDTYSTAEDTALTVPPTGVLTNDTRPRAAITTAQLVTGPGNGTLVLATDGGFTYTPNADFHGSDAFTYRARVGASQSNIATVTITVTPVNDAPTAINDSATTTEDTAVDIVVVGNDTDGDTANADLRVVAASIAGVRGGTAVLLAGGRTVRFTPAANANSDNTTAGFGFTYQVTDGTTPSANTATVTITVSAANDAPTAVNDSVTTTEDTAVEIVVVSNDTDGDSANADLRVVPASIATVRGGTAVLLADGRTVRFTPAANANSDNTTAGFGFTYQVTDGTTPSANTATVTITVSAANDAPSFDAIANQTINEDAPAQKVDITNVSAGEADQTVTLIATSSNTALIANPGVVGTTATRTLTYQPAAGASGTATITVTATDSATPAATFSRTFTITVNAVNDAPVAVNDAYTTNEDTELSIAAAAGVLANDTDSDSATLTAVLITAPTKGTLTLNANGSLSYKPAANVSATDTFTYKANDGASDSAPATVTITINAVNDAPVAVNDTYSTDEETALTVAAASGLLANDTDSDSTGLSSALMSGPTKGTLALNASGSFTYTPNANVSGTDTFTYKVSDGLLDSNVATVTITINGINDAPVAVNDGYSTAEDTALTIAAAVGVLANDTDADSTALTAALGTGPAHGTVALNPNGSFTYTPNANYGGPDTFTYTVSDGTLQSAAATVTITVNAVNDAPALAPIGGRTVAENATVTVTLTATDADGDALTYSSGALPAGSSFDPTTRTFVWTPGYSQAGQHSVTFSVRDTAGATDSETITIDVTNTNRAPVVTAPASQTSAEGNTVSLQVVATDADGDPLTYTATGLPAGLAINASAVISGVLATGSAGTHTVTITAADGKGGTHSAGFSWTVTSAAVSTTTTLSSPTANPTTYGQSVVLNASVARVGGGTTPTGSIDFLDGTAVLGNAALVNGAASLTTSSIGAGTRTVRAVYKPATGFTGSEAAITRTVNKATATGTFLTLSPIQKQYSDRVLMEATMSAWSPGDTVTFQIGTTVLATVPVVNGKASSNVQALGAPGSRIVTAVFNSPNYTAANVSKSMSIIKEDARVAYAGTPGETLCLCGNATVAVTVNVSDITAIDPVGDPDAGNVGTATVTFNNRTTLATYGTVTVAPHADGKTGTATYYFPASALGTATSQTVTFGFIVSGNYNRNNVADNVTITIKK